MFIYTRFGVNFIWILKHVSLVPGRKTYSHEYIYDEIKELEIFDLFILIIEDHRVIHCTSFIHSSWPSHTHRKVPCVITLPFWIKLEKFHQTLYSCLPWKWQWVYNLPCWTAYTCLLTTEAASLWDRMCNNIYLWMQVTTDCTDTSQWCHNCHCGMRAIERLTLYQETVPTEGPKRTSMLINYIHTTAHGVYIWFLKIAHYGWNSVNGYIIDEFSWQMKHVLCVCVFSICSMQ